MIRVIKYTGLLIIIMSLFSFKNESTANNGRPNILFIEVDDLNYEYLSALGSNIVKTPNIDRLAENGVLFRNAVCQGMMCGPSRNSTMTGQYPHNLGFYLNGEMKALPEGIWTFPAALQRTGYYTAWIGKCHIRPGKGDKTIAMRENMGFDFVEQTEGRVVITRKAKDENPEKASRTINNDWYLSFLKENGLLERFIDEYPGISTLPEDFYLDGFFTRNALDFLSGYNEDKPFFLWLNYSVPHGPYDVASGYHEPYPPADMPGSTKINYRVPKNLVKKTVIWTNEEKHKIEQAGHCASVGFMDRQVGRIMEHLEKLGIIDKTIVVFFSDQGVMLGDHQRQHKGTLFRQVTNPALIIYYPGGKMQGLVVNSPVELTDLVQTVLEESEALPSDISHLVAGYSLLPILKGESERVRKYAFGEVEGYVMVTDGRYRLIQGIDAQLLFDDLEDPKNLVNIAGRMPEKTMELSVAIEKWFEATGPALPPRTF